MYDPTENYVNLHLEWIRNNPRFRAKGGLDIINTTLVHNHPKSYLEQQQSLYATLQSEGSKERANKWAYNCLLCDLKWKNGGAKDINERVNTMFGITPVIDYPKFFITFNFSEDLFKPDKVLKDLAKFMAKSWIKTLDGVFEYHTNTNNHPHLMMVISVDKYKNKILCKMKESILSKYCKDLAFIDVMKWEPRHDDYIALDKAPSKKDLLDKDVLWRIEQNLPHSIKK